MSDSLRRSRVTVTLGSRGGVVKRTGRFSDEGIWNGVPVAGRKRSIKDRLGGGSEDKSDFYNKRMRGDSPSNSNGTFLGEDDLRFKLMKKNMGQQSRINEPLRNVDLRDKLSNRNSRPSADNTTMQPASMQHFMVDPRIGEITRQPIHESRDSSLLGRFPPLRNLNELSSIGPPQRYSSRTLENLRRRSPEILRRRSPDLLRRRSPDLLRRRSPDLLRRRSPDLLRRRSPDLLRRRSPEVLRRRSPEVLRRRSPDVLRRRSPEVLRRRSPEVLRRRSPELMRRRSPETMRRRSPEIMRRRSPEGLRREGLRRISPVRLISPEGLRRISPVGRISPEGLRRRSPGMLFRPSPVRGLSPESREYLQRRPLIRPYDDGRSTAYARTSPRRAVQSSPYLAQTSVPAPRVPAPHYAHASGIMQRTPSAVDVPPTVERFLQSLGLEKYAIFFKAEEVDMNALRQMGDNDLRGLGIPMGPRKMILEAVMSCARRQRAYP